MSFILGFLLLAILLLSMAKLAIAAYIYTALIGLGIAIDALDFFFRFKAWIGRKRVPSAIPVLGYLLVLVGLIGFAVKSLISWKVFFLMTLLALFLHLSFQMLFPLAFTILCNVYYGRKLLDFSPLPEMRQKD